MQFKTPAPAVDEKYPATPIRSLLTDDPEEVLNFALMGFRRLQSTALVTLVSISGGASRAIGAQMAVNGDGTYCGFVSGGCTEAAVAAEAIAALNIGESRFLHLGEGSKFFDIVLPCGGSITLYIHVIKDVTALTDAVALLARRQPACLRFAPRPQTMSTAATTFPTAWQDHEFYRSYRPRVRLLICGRGIEASATERIGTASGFDIRVFDGSNQLDTALIDDDTAVALLFHDLDLEVPLLCSVLSRNPFYVGALGSQRTHASRCKALWRLGVTTRDTDRLRAPIGLVPKARDANTLALSVLADIAAVRSQTLYGQLTPTVTAQPSG